MNIQTLFAINFKIWEILFQIMTNFRCQISAYTVCYYHGHLKVLCRYKDKVYAPKFWIAQSLNESEYDNFDIEIAEVRSWKIVKLYIRSDILL